MDRRAFLAGTGLAVAGAAGLAGCLGAGPAGIYPGDGDGTDDGGMDDGGGSDGGGSDAFGGHASTAGIADEPFLGPEPGTATGTIVAFEDPSCPRCATFERNTVPKIESRLVDPGKATFVFRGYPVIYPWGKPATQALEATFARDADAFWALKDHYYAEQDGFTSENVLDRTETFLAGETDLDAAAVVGDAREKAFDDRVQADLEAGRVGGAGGITPTVFLFRDGEFRTKARGSVSYETIAAALGL